MESALVITSSKKSGLFFTEILKAASVETVVILNSCHEARRLLGERAFDLTVINTTLLDSACTELCADIAAEGAGQVILLVKSEDYGAAASLTESCGVLAVSKPINRALFWSALMLAKSAHSRLISISAENSKLKRKIEDIRIIDRAKCILISYLGMSEQEAHRYIEKQAMDMRTTKRAMAEGILKTYEN